MRVWLQRTVAACAAATALFGVGLMGATTASAAPAPATAKAVTGTPYIYGYYKLYLDCDSIGALGVYQGNWQGYVCDNRYLAGYFALVVVPY
ncbi:hypothetical protein [Kutzneria sp. NPDC052558]|uniref:hypothetical protein n=1 Tax=Kutzneria sp. NPDC052558 TaxID=3364121 RepID=UPI0037C5988F